MTSFSRSGYRRSPRGIALAIAASLLSATPVSAGDLSTQIDIASDRIFRGLAQSNGLSLSARGDYAFDSRAYAGAFAANNRLAGDAEFDIYAGYRKPLVFRDLIAYSLDAGLSANFYTGDHAGPRAQNLDYAEAYAGVAAGPASFKVYFAPDYYNLGAAAYRFNGSLRLPLTSRLSFAGSLAWNGGEGVRLLTAARSEDRRGREYLDYSGTLNQQLPHGFGAYLQVAGTNLDVDGRRFPRVLIGVQKRFDF